MHAYGQNRFTPTRGLVFSAFGEASADVHDLISVASDALAQRQWRLSGARSASVGDDHEMTGDACGGGWVIHSFSLWTRHIAHPARTGA